jgi:hypothetical protein
MKYAFYAILVLAIASIIYNGTLLDFNNILQGDSQVAAISIVAALCVAILMAIVLVSRKIEEKQNL